jgi:uncharacterized phage-associated protein
MSNYPAPAIANAFLERHAGAGKLTQMQLQKLSYFAHGWNLAVNGEPLVAGGFQAWDYGPVSPSLYDHTRYFGSNPIPRVITQKDADRLSFFLNKNEDLPPYRASLSANEIDVIDRVFARYGDKDAFTLSELTHQPGTPWHQCYKRGQNRPIPDDVITAHYRDIAQGAA